jgi:hypothetical protein
VHAKLRIPSGITWTPQQFIDDVVSLMTGETDPGNLGLFTTDVSIGGNGGITSIIPAGWELVGKCGYGDEGYPAITNGTTGSYVALLRAPVDDNTGRYKYLGLQMSNAGYLQVNHGDVQRGANYEAKFSRTGWFGWSIIQQFVLTNGADVSINCSARHFGFITPSYTSSIIGSYLLMERTQEHPADVDTRYPSFVAIWSDNSRGYNSVSFKFPSVSGFGANNTPGDYAISAQVSGTSASNYAYGANFGGIEADGVYRGHLCPFVFIGDYSVLGRQHPDIHMYAIGRKDAPLLFVGDHVTLEGRTFECWYIGSSWRGGTTNYPYYVELL